MTLLLINSRFLPLIGGGETYTLELMRNFVRKGWDVHLLTQERGFGETSWEGCTVHYIDGFDDNDLHIHKCTPMLRKVLDEVQPDLVHVHNIMPYFIFSSVVEPDEFPTVLTIHNTPLLPERVFGSFKDFESERLFTRQLLANEKYDTLLVGSGYYLDSYAEVAPWIRKNGEVAYYFPPDITTGPLKPKQIDFSGKINLLFPSRILKRKGIEETIQALAKLPDQFTLSLPSFAHAEDESYRLEIEKMIENLGLKDRIYTASQVTTPEMMRGFYKNADIVLIPSHYEGFGIVAVEAMSWGVPVVASKVGGLGEIVRDGTNGISVVPQDADSIVDAVRLLAASDELARKVVEGGIETVENVFNRQSHMRQIESVYDRALQHGQMAHAPSETTAIAS